MCYFLPISAQQANMGKVGKWYSDFLFEGIYLKGSHFPKIKGILHGFN